ncbi:MAG: hypothetical protein IPL27_23070 [Lewinellaceae bacterium]|nr:hypothetical protein [Lewinellaceae bacterium]
MNGPTAGTSPTFTAEPNAYRINNMSYDKAGNIKTLKRQGKPGALPMDDLNYNYAATLPNRLTSVTDNAAAGAYKDDLESQAANNYLYNGIGQLITDVMADQNYAYDPAGNVTAITHSNGTPVLRFEYNETGLRQRKVTYDNSGNELKSTWYVYGSEGSLMSVYETQAGATIQTELPVYGMGRAGVYDKGSNSYTYELTDHLGNVRATVRQNAGVAEVLLFNDYYPHGSVMPGRNFSTALPYRFDYQGQERTWKRDSAILNCGSTTAASGAGSTPTPWGNIIRLTWRWGIIRFPTLTPPAAGIAMTDIRTIWTE